MTSSDESFNHNPDIVFIDPQGDPDSSNWRELIHNIASERFQKEPEALLFDMLDNCYDERDVANIRETFEKLMEDFPNVLSKERFEELIVTGVAL